jgi:hypothetical protein
LSWASPAPRAPRASPTGTCPSRPSRRPTTGPSGSPGSPAAADRDPVPKGTWVAPRIHLGALLPLLSRKADYAGGLGIGASFEIGIQAKNVLWVRPSADVGFLSADEDDWESDSTLLLVHLDAGLDWVHTRELRFSTFLALGAGVEFFSAAGTSGAKEDFSETNGNALLGGGLSLGFRLTPELTLEAAARVTFPLGSRNVRGLALVGVSAAYRF